MTWLRLFLAYLRSIRIVWAPLTFCIILENLISFDPIFLDLNRTWVTLTQARGTLSNISLFFNQKGKMGWGGGRVTPTFCRHENICKVKTWELKVRCKWNLNDICTTLAPFISQKWGCQWLGGRRAHTQKHQKML